MYWMLARVLQAADMDTKTTIVQEVSRMNCNIESRVTRSTSPTGEQMFKRLSASDIIMHTSDAVLAGSTPRWKVIHSSQDDILEIHAKSEKAGD